MAALIVTYLLSPLLKVGSFLATRGGAVMTAAITFTGLVASLYALVSSNVSGVTQYIQPITNAASSMRSYLEGVGSLAQAVMYYTACDQLYSAFSALVGAILGILSAALLVAVSLLFAAMLPILITQISTYLIRNITS